jgi:hypothetical protein
MKFYKIPWQWKELPSSLSQQGEALKRVLLEWEGTPYFAGSAIKQGGVDCVRFICALFKELEGQPLNNEIIKLLPPDAAMHTKSGSIRVMKYILKLLDPIYEIVPPFVEPGDILVVGPTNGGPGHAMIVSPWKNVLVHAGTSEVCKTGFHLSVHYQKIFHVFRKGNRQCWA